MKKLQNGRSMIEMLGVLAIIGVLSVGGLAGYTMAMNRHRANQAVDYAQRAFVAVQTWGDGTDKIDNIACSKALDEKLTSGLVKCGVRRLDAAGGSYSSVAIEVQNLKIAHALAERTNLLSLGGEIDSALFYYDDKNNGWSQTCQLGADNCATAIVAS